MLAIWKRVVPIGIYATVSLTEDTGGGCSCNTLKHDHIHGLQHRQYGVGRNPFCIIKKAGTYFSRSVVNVGVEYAGQALHLHTEITLWVLERRDCAKRDGTGADARPHAQIFVTYDKRRKRKTK